ncbi:MAG TPA: hypothetical protein VNT01_17395, partial [Symbiobacteriaceae bacterium]|nr:hypothetical protein [Symbiobacteriaceae bacterium]
MGNASEFAALTAHLLAHFHPGGTTALIGGNAQTAWLTAQGFSTVSDTTFLPDLAGVSDGAVSNILCADALATVPREDLITAVFSLGRILQPEGRVVLTMPAGPDAPVPIGKLVLLLESTGIMVSLTRELTPSTTLIVAEKTSLQAARGLERIQSVLVQDKKFATYKLALIRAFCGIARNEPHVVRWGQGYIYVPMWFVARRWLMYYWPFFTGDKFIAQRRGEVQDGDKPIKFRRTLVELSKIHAAGGLQSLLTNLDLYPNDYRKALQAIAETVREGPVTHAGSEATPLFGYSRTCPVGPTAPEGQFGWIMVPEAVWLDISRFHHWIEDSLILRWAHLTTEMDP